MNRDEIRRIDEETRGRYNKRLEEHGPSARAVGWDSEASQWTRFSVAIQGADLNGKTVMDIGCGLADFYRFLKSRGITVGQYIGVDINPKLLAIAQEKFPEAHFEKRNILLEPFSHQVCDIAVMNGVLNFRFKVVDNYEYAREMIKRAFAACRELLIVDMLSSAPTALIVIRMVNAAANIGVHGYKINRKLFNSLRSDFAKCITKNSYQLVREGLGDFNPKISHFLGLHLLFGIAGEMEVLTGLFTLVAIAIGFAVGRGNADTDRVRVFFEVLPDILDVLFNHFIIGQAKHRPR